MINFAKSKKSKSILIVLVCFILFEFCFPTYRAYASIIDWDEVVFNAKIIALQFFYDIGYGILGVMNNIFSNEEHDINILENTRNGISSPRKYNNRKIFDI